MEVLTSTEGRAEAPSAIVCRLASHAAHSATWSRDTHCSTCNTSGPSLSRCAKRLSRSRASGEGRGSYRCEHAHLFLLADLHRAADAAVGRCVGLGGLERRPLAYHQAPGLRSPQHLPALPSSQASAHSARRKPKTFFVEEGEAEAEADEC